MTIQIEPFGAEHTDEVLAAINAAFGFERSLDWFRWKHLDGPWGPSTGMVATDSEGVVGVRLLLPWRFIGPTGELTAHRAVEAATTPRARGQGVFSSLNRALMEEASARDEPTFLFSTPNEQSRTGYQKLGWFWLEPVPHVYRPVVPASKQIELLEGEEAFAAFAPSRPEDRIATEWTEDALRWRLDARAGHRYQIVAASAGPPAGLAYRLASERQPRSILPLVAWGPEARRRQVLRTVARRESAALVLDTGLPGGWPVSTGLGKQRGGSLLAVWPTPDLQPSSWPLEPIANWRLAFADLESVL